MNTSRVGSLATGPFDITSCRARMLEAGLPLILSVTDCEWYCGKGYGRYNAYDALDAITTWLIPLLALSANMIFADSSLLPVRYGGKIFVVVRQYADPIGTISSLASKLALGSNLYESVQRLDLTALKLPSGEEVRAIRDISNILYCMDDFGSDELQERVGRVLRLLASHGRALYPDIRTASRHLSQARVRNTLSSYMAIVVYIGAAFSALLKSNNSTQLDYAQPHTIALRVLCYFLLLQIILGSAAGGWSERWRLQFIMAELGERFHEYDPTFGWLDLGTQQVLPWNGGIYCFRPHEGLFYRWKSTHTFSKISIVDSCRRHTLKLALAILAVWTTFTISFMMSWLTPTRGLGGRGVAEISYVALWTTNFLINECIGGHVKNRKRLFFLIWAKDTIISLLVVLFFFLPFIGWYNSCKSWSAYFSKGTDGYIDLDLGQLETNQTWSLYFTGIVAGAAIQGIFALLIIIGLNYDACKLSRRGEKENWEDLARGKERAKDRVRSLSVSVPIDYDPKVVNIKTNKDEEKKLISLKVEEVQVMTKTSTDP